MSDVFYTPPAAELMDSAKKGSPFFTVSVTKLTVMLIVTSGLYGVYWCFKNWSHYKAYSGRSLWPFPRTLFGPFYMPSLFYKVDAVLNEQGNGRLPHRGLLATGMILLVVGPWCFGFLFGLMQGRSAEAYGMGTIPTFALSNAIFVLQCLIVRRVQAFINLANGDADGSRNSYFTRWNVLWVAIGVMYWGAAIMLTISMNQSPL